MHIKLIGCNGRFTHSTLSLFYLRQLLESKVENAQVIIEQYTINDAYFETLARITTGPCHCYCFSVYIWNNAFIRRLLDDLSLLAPDIPLVIGGPEAPALAKTVDLANLTLVKGEAEGLPAAFYTDLLEGNLAKSYNCAVKPSFASPYRDSDFRDLLANRHIYYESSRGCPFSCSYCLSARETGVRHLELSQVKEELAAILPHKPQIIRFIDRTFNTLPQRSIELWRYLLSLETDTAFHFEVSPDLFTDEMFALLETAPAGKFQFELGLQSTHPDTLAAVNRKTLVETALANIKRLTAIDTIHLHVDLILGLPFETPASYQKTFDDLFDIAPHYIQMGLLKVLPDTPLSHQQDEFALVASRQPPYELLQNKWFTHNTLKRYYWFGECVEKFYNNHFFKPLFTYLVKREESGFDFFTDLLTICRRHQFFERAATHELMSRILAELAAERQDSQTFLEILQLCWLYSGGRRLPAHLPHQDLKKNKEDLYKLLPQNLPPYYNHTDRNHFFKQVEFAHFSGAAIASLFPVPGTSSQTICFLPELQNKAIKHQQILLVDHNQLNLSPAPF